MEKKIRIFVIFHDNITPDYYQGDLKDYLTFVNVTPNNPNTEKIQQQGYEVINQYEFKNFIPLGKQYAESEVIYNIYKNSYLTDHVDYVGFMQYDMHTHHLSKAELDALVGAYTHIAFDEHKMLSDHKIGYLKDGKYPEKWIGRGKNCYIAILEDYNQFYGSRHILKELLPKNINLCCTFLLDKNHYNLMMEFIGEVIESGKLDIFDRKRRFRMQGGLLERYFGVWLAINAESYFHRPIEHVFDTSTAIISQRSFFNRLLIFLRSKV